MSDTASAQQTDAGDTGGTQTGTATPATQVEAPRFTQEDVNRLLADEKRKLKKQQDEAADKIKRDTEERAAVEKGEFEKLATERGNKLAQVEADHTSLTERYDSLVALIEKQAQARIKQLPDEIKAMKPEGDILALLDWIGKAEAAASKLQTQRTPGTPPGPQGVGSGAQPVNFGADITTQKRTSGEYAL